MPIHGNAEGQCGPSRRVGWSECGLVPSAVTALGPGVGILLLSVGEWHAVAVTVRDLFEESDGRAVTVDAYFMHPKLVFNLLTPGGMETILNRLPAGSDSLAIRMRQSLLDRQWRTSSWPGRSRRSPF